MHVDRSRTMYFPDEHQTNWNILTISIALWLLTLRTGYVFAQDAQQDIQPIAILEGHAGSVNSIAYSPDGHTLASGGVKVIQLWDVQSGKLKAKLYSWPGVYGEDSLVYSPDGSMLASAGRPSPTPNFRVWDVQDISNIPCVPLQCGKLIAILEGRPASLAFSPDSSILASGGGLWEATIKLWKLREPTAVAVSPKWKNMTLDSQEKV